MSKAVKILLADFFVSKFLLALTIELSVYQGRSSISPLFAGKTTFREVGMQTLNKSLIFKALNPTNRVMVGRGQRKLCQVCLQNASDKGAPGTPEENSRSSPLDYTLTSAPNGMD